MKITMETGIYYKNNTYLKNIELEIMEIAKRINIKLGNSSLENKECLINNKGMGISENNFFIRNYGQIDIRNGLKIVLNHVDILEGAIRTVKMLSIDTFNRDSIMKNKIGYRKHKSQNFMECRNCL